MPSHASTVSAKVLIAGLISRLLSRLTVASYFCLFPLVGLTVACIGFCDPDTCWHLALGKWMSAHNQLPIVDPFSSNIKDFVFAGTGRPIMQHEWLADCIFYRLYDFGGAGALLLLVAAVSAAALIISPALFMIKSATPRLVAVLCLLATTPACLFRLWVRPEVFSFAFLSTLIWLVEAGRKSTADRFVCCSLATFALLALWANCHALFVLGLFYLLLHLILTSIQWLVSGRAKCEDRTGTVTQASQMGRIFVLTLAALCGSLCTPWQGALWLYVVKIISSPAALSNKENGALDLSNLAQITLLPLAISFIFVALLFLRLLYGKKISLRMTVLPIGLYGSALTFALLFRRFTPFAVLILISAVAALFRQVKQMNAATRSGQKQHWSVEQWTIKSQYILGRAGVPGMASGLLGLFLLMATTWIAATFLIKPEVPSSSRFFRPACQALLYLEKQRPPGRLLNDSKLGSMLTFCLANPPDIFIDGRFDSYDRQLIEDYQTMRLAKPGYRDLLRRYKIDWVFFPPATPLIGSLERQSGWQVCYRDGDAVILSRVASLE